MDSNLLRIPYRKTDWKDVRLELLPSMENTYNVGLHSLNKILEIVQNSRDRITHLSCENLREQHEADEDSIIDYYSILSLLRDRIPDDALQFTWYTTLGGEEQPVPFKSRSLVEEQYNMMYQLGCFYSLMIEVGKPELEAFLKKYCMQFQRSAGCFDYLLRQLKSSPSNREGLIGLLSESLEFLKWLMLAEAQELVWQKAIVTKSKDTLIAKLAMQVSEYYSFAFKFSEKDNSVNRKFFYHVLVKLSHFRAVFHWRMANHSQENFQYGVQILHLRLAAEYIADGSIGKPFIDEAVLKDFEGLEKIIMSTLRIAQKNNEFIHHNVIPGREVVGNIKGISLVYPIQPSNSLEKNWHVEEFDLLIPYFLLETAEAFRQRQESFVTDNIMTKTLVENKKTYRFLITKEISSLIDTIHNPEGLPLSIVRHAQEIISDGGFESIEHSLGEMCTLEKLSRNLVAECRKTIYIPKFMNDSNYETSYFSLNQRVNRMNDYLDEASRGDQVIHHMYNEVKKTLQLYQLDRELNEMIPKAHFFELDNSSSEIISRVQRHIEKVISFVSSRKSIAASAEIATRNDDILAELFGEYKKKFLGRLGDFTEELLEKVYLKHINAFHKYVQTLEDIDEQCALCESEIETLCEQVISIFNSADATQIRRKEALQSLEVVYIKYLDLKDNLDDGFKFYHSFLEKGNVVLLECKNFIDKLDRKTIT